MSPNTTIAPDAATLIARAEGLVPLLREHADEADHLRRLPDVVADAFGDAGFHTAMRPASVGGSAIDFATFIDITRILSRGDASGGWVGSFLISHQWLLSRLNAEAQAEIFGRGPGLAAAAAVPPGTVEPVPGGYRVNGRWRFMSAIMHANWAIVSAMGPAGPVAVVANVGEGEIHDVWHVPGMRGTASNDFELRDAFIPSHRVVDFIPYAGRLNDGIASYPDYEILNYPMHRVLTLIHGAVAVGTAEAALEAFKDLAAKRILPKRGVAAITQPEAHAAYGEASRRALQARLLLDDAVARTQRLYALGTPDPSFDERAVLNLAVTASGTEALKAVDVIVQASGSSVHRDGQLLDRICRDTQVMRSHITLDWRSIEMLAGRVLLGHDVGDVGDPTF